MVVRDTIAVIFDFDDTLGQNTTNLLLREELGMEDTELEHFWNVEVARLVRKGWDLPLAYIHLILSRIKRSSLSTTNDDLRQLGRQVKLYPGVLALFRRLRYFVRDRKQFREAHVKGKLFVVHG